MNKAGYFPATGLMTIRTFSSEQSPMRVPEGVAALAIQRSDIAGRMTTGHAGEQMRGFRHSLAAFSRLRSGRLAGRCPSPSDAGKHRMVHSGRPDAGTLMLNMAAPAFLNICMKGGRLLGEKRRVRRVAGQACGRRDTLHWRMAGAAFLVEKGMRFRQRSRSCGHAPDGCARRPRCRRAGEQTGDAEDDEHQTKYMGKFHSSHRSPK